MTELQRSPAVQQPLESPTPTLFQSDWSINVDPILLQLGLDGLQRLQTERAPKLDEALPHADEINRPLSITSATAPEDPRGLLHAILASPDLQKLFSSTSAQPTITAATPFIPIDSTPRVSRFAHSTEMEIDCEEDPTSSAAAVAPFHKPNNSSDAVTASTSQTNSSNGVSHSNNTINSRYMTGASLKQCRNSMSSLVLKNITLRSMSNSNGFSSASQSDAPRNVKALLSDEVCEAFMKKVMKSQLQLREKIRNHSHDNGPRSTAESHVDFRRRNLSVEPEIPPGSPSSWGKSPQTRYQDDAYPRTARKRWRQSDDESNSEQDYCTPHPLVQEHYNTSTNSLPLSYPLSSDLDDCGSPTAHQHDMRSRSRDTISVDLRNGENIPSHNHMRGESHHSSKKLKVEHQNEQRHGSTMLNDVNHSGEGMPCLNRDDEHWDLGNSEQDKSWIQHAVGSHYLLAKPSDIDSGLTPHSSSTLNDSRASQTPATSNIDFHHIQTPDSNANACVLPCHNVPGLWFLQQALHSPGILECNFYIDHATVQKWHLDSGLEDVSSDIVLKLNLFCLSYEKAKTVLTPPVPEALADAAWNCSPKQWPEQGTLLIQVNPDKNYGRSWMPADLSPDSPPLDITNSVGFGTNVIRCIQLAPAYCFFILHATTGANPDWNGFENFLGNSNLRDTEIDATVRCS